MRDAIQGESAVASKADLGIARKINTPARTRRIQSRPGVKNLPPLNSASLRRRVGEFHHRTPPVARAIGARDLGIGVQFIAAMPQRRP